MVTIVLGRYCDPNVSFQVITVSRYESMRVVEGEAPTQITYYL
jgi:hypothetical protein